MKDIGLTKPRGMNYACEPKAGMPSGSVKPAQNDKHGYHKPGSTTASRQAHSIQNKK